MRTAPERLPWLDALRGAAVLAIVPLNARWLLHPADAYHDPAVAGERGVLGWVWWALPELLLDHSTLFVLAAVFGMSMAAARDADASPDWTRRHLTRLALLAVIGFAHGALLWPGDILFTYALAGALLTGAVREREPGSNGLLWTGCAAAAIPPVLGIAALQDVLAGYRAVGVDPAEAYVLATPDYRAWESASYSGNIADNLAVKWQQWNRQLGQTLPYHGLWHAAGGMLAGVWWQRRGRRLESILGMAPPDAAATTTTAGLALTSAALLIATGAGYGAATLAAANWLTYAGGALLAAGAVIGFTHAGRRCWDTAAGAWLRTCGQASLSLYLGANLLLAAVAQGWGLGLHGRLDPEQTAATVLAVMTVMAWAGWAKLRRPDMPLPAERAWRIATRLLCGGRPRPERPPGAPSRAERRRTARAKSRRKGDGR